MPLNNISQNAELILSLLQEELKSRKFFNMLGAAGLGDSFYQADLGDVILRLFGMENPPEAVADFYDHVIEKHSGRLVANKESLKLNALMAYAELMAGLRFVG